MGQTTHKESDLIAEVEELREKFPKTQDLYREVCALLFFRYGITPTANKLYQLVKKGSMSAPAEALAKFWTDLREKSRVRIEHPDLPEELKSIAGDLTAAIWSNAQALAKESLADLQEAAKSSIQEAQAAQAEASDARNKALQELQKAHETIKDKLNQIYSLEQQLSTEVTEKHSIEAQYKQASSEIARLQSMLDSARQEFSAELDKQRASLAQAEERLNASESRALLEIDRERTVSAKVQKEIEQVRRSANEAADRCKAEISGLHSTIGELRQQIGQAEGRLAEAKSENDRALENSRELRAQLTDALLRNSNLENEVSNLHLKAEERSVGKTRKSVKKAPQS